MMAIIKNNIKVWVSDYSTVRKCQSIMFSNTSDKIKGILTDLFVNKRI